MAMWNGHDEEDTETHGAIHTREAYEKLSIVCEKVREGCHHDLSCVRRYHFDFEFFIPIHLKLHNSLRTAKSYDKHIWAKQLTKLARIMPAEKIYTCLRGPTGNPGRETIYETFAVSVTGRTRRPS